MADRVQTWGVVLTVDEPPALVGAHARWHLALGAAEVHIYVDDPQAPDIKELPLPDAVRLVWCDEMYWSAHPKGRPHRHEVRQVANARDAYVQCGVDWLLHCDADEFLWAAGSVAEVLSDVPEASDAVTVPVAERVHSLRDRGRHALEGVFRRPFQGHVARGRRLFGPDYALTNRGLTGHTQGKAFARTGRSLRPSIHRPRAARHAPPPVLHHAGTASLEMLHVDGLTPLHWAYKLMRMQRALRLDDGMPPAPHRAAQAAALMADPGRYAGLYKRLKHPGPLAQGALRGLGLWRSGPDLTQAGGLSPDTVDAWLMANKAEVVSDLLEG